MFNSMFVTGQTVPELVYSSSITGDSPTQSCIVPETPQAVVYIHTDELLKSCDATQIPTATVEIISAEPLQQLCLV